MAVLGLAMAMAVSVSGPKTGFGRAQGQVSLWAVAPEKFTLATGIPCIYQQHRVSPTTVIGVVIAGGRSAVPAGLDGLAAMSTRLLLEIPDEGKVQDLMAQATSLSYVCLEDCSIILVECLSENIEEALRVAAAIIQDPLISGLRVGRAKDLMTANLKIEADDAVGAARAAVFRAFFGDAGCGTAVYGTELSLKAVGRKDVLAFNKRFLVKPNVFFCVETDLDRETVRRLLEGSFASIPDGPPAVLTPQAPALPPDRVVNLVKETKQTYVGRAFALPRAGLADMAKGALVETLLGKGPGSRLWTLRTDERLAYGVNADLTWTRGAGILIAYLETGRAKTAGAEAALDRVIAGLRENGVSAEEAESARTLAGARFVRSVEGKSPRLRTIGLFEILGPAGVSPAAFFEALGTVTTEDLNAFIREVLAPERAIKVTVGPAAPGPAQGEPPCPD
jgi:zinc protease